MTGRIAFPYLKVASDLVHASDWALEVPGSAPKTVGVGIPGWDYQQDLVLVREIRIPIEKCLKSCGLAMASGASVRLSIECETGPTGYRWLAHALGPMQSGSLEETIRVSLNGNTLAGAVTLTTGLHLENPGSRSESLAPHRPGTRLWEESRTIQLEGSMGRFPMEAVDFQAAFGHLNLGAARWILYWEPRRWDWAFLGNVQLFLNSADSELMTDIQEERAPLLAAIISDVVRQMTTALIVDEEFREEMSKLPDWTVGGVVRDWLELAFPEDPPDVLVGRVRENPGQFEARVQAVFGGVGR